jgi:hypothetical protein
MKSIPMNTQEVRNGHVGGIRPGLKIDQYGNLKK